MTDDPNPDRAELVPTSSRRLTPPRSSERCTDCSGDAVGASEQPDQDIHKDRQPDRQQQRQHQAARHEADLGTLTGPLREEKHEALLYPRSRSATGGARTATGVPLVALPVRTGEVRFRERKSGEGSRWRRTYGLRTCPVCGREFTATHHNQRFCPPTDLDRARARNSQPRSRCAKRADNGKQGGWDPASRPLLEPFDCAQCGKRCVPGQNVPANATRFCSRAHKRDFHRAAEKAVA
jgi:hypothetical protein